MQDFLYLTEANSHQQVAYTATLLQEAAADWWVSLLKERNGRRPDDFLELAVLLEKRFGSSTRVDRARADLRNIRQGQSETVRSYSTRFEALLGKLPTFDKEWAKTQFIWGLHQRIAELVTIAGPSDLHAAINHAEKVEMAQNLAGSGQGGQRPPMQSRGRIGFNRGRGRFNAMQITSTPIIPVNQSVNPQQIAVQQTTWNKRPIGYEQCAYCKGWGHWASECPSYRQGSCGGRGRFTCGRRGGNRRGRFGGRHGGWNSGNGGNQAVNAALTMSESRCTWISAATGLGCNPSAYALARKLAGPLRGQPSLLGARSDDPGRHDPRVKIGGLCEGNPTTKMQNYKYRSKEEALAARKHKEKPCTEDAAPSCNPALDGSQRGRESTTQDAEARRCQKMENVYPM